MREIVLSMQSGEPVASSRQIAENFGKEHKNVIQAVANLVAENSAAKSMFYETTFENRGKQYPMYLMNRDGFSLLVMGFTGKAALEWKLKYIAAFNEMEKKLTEQPQRSMEMKLFTIKETVICHSDGHTSVNTTTKVTGIGQVYFVNLFLKTEKSKKEEG